jgi:hypothetical protein
MLVGGTVTVTVDETPLDSVAGKVRVNVDEVGANANEDVVGGIVTVTINVSEVGVAIAVAIEVAVAVAIEVAVAVAIEVAVADRGTVTVSVDSTPPKVEAGIVTVNVVKL